MPIRPENVARYPKNWKQIRAAILERAGDKCEECGIPNGVYRNRNTGEWTRNEMQVEVWTCVDGDQVTRIVLTIAHLNHTPEDCRPENLKALCQRDHLRYDQGEHLRTAYRSRRKGKAACDLFDMQHSGKDSAK
jgi:hypothetical protein